MVAGKDHGSGNTGREVKASGEDRQKKNPEPSSNCFPSHLPPCSVPASERKIGSQSFTM